MHGAALLRKHDENAGYRFSPGRSLRHYSALADRCPCGFPEVFPTDLWLCFRTHFSAWRPPIPTCS